MSNVDMTRTAAVPQDGEIGARGVIDTSKTPTSGSLCDCELSHNGFGMMGRECDCPAGIGEIAHVFRRGQREMQHRAAEAVIKSSKGKGCTEQQRQLLVDAVQAILALEVTS